MGYRRKVWEYNKLLIFQMWTLVSGGGRKTQVTCINFQHLPLPYILIRILFYVHGDCDSWLGHYLQNLLHFLNLRLSIVEGQGKGRKVRACIPYNLTNSNADTSPGRSSGGGNLICSWLCFAFKDSWSVGVKCLVYMLWLMLFWTQLSSMSLTLLAWEAIVICGHCLRYQIFYFGLTLHTSA